jgi:hypothetical protein
MIGDANGDMEFSIDFSELDPSTEKLLTALAKLGDFHPKGHWGWVFDSEHYRLAIEEGVLTKEDIEAFEIENEELESWEVIRSEGEGYWLCYRGYQVTYTDETGLEHPCKVIL